jgi:hypothetical protein
VLAAAVLIAASSLASAADEKSAQQLLDSAHSPADLFLHATSPFKLDVDFTNSIHKSYTGHLTVLWQSRDHWRSRITYAGFDQTVISDGDRRYTWGSADFMMFWDSELFNLLGLVSSSTSGSTTIIATRSKNRNVHGVTLTCIDTQVVHGIRTKLETCLTPDTHDLVREVRSEPHTNKEQRSYSNYFEFEGLRFPRNLRLDKSGNSIQANVINLSKTVISRDQLVPAPGAAMRRECLDKIPPKPIYTHDPEPGKDFDSKGLTGALALFHVTVLADGSVTDIKVVSSDNSGFAAASAAKIAKWLFKPALCGNEPIVTDITVESRYQRY